MYILPTNLGPGANHPKDTKVPQAIDPFIHHPELRGKIIDPSESNFRDLDVTKLDQKMWSRGEEVSWRHSDAYREDSRRKTLDSVMPCDLWVFAYGSLMWDPAFIFEEVRIAHLSRHERRFCLKSVVGRGTPEKPGLMAGLDDGQGCDGLAFRVPQALVEEETRIIWRREMLLHAYSPVFLTATTSLGQIEVLAFVVDHSANNYLPNLTLQQAARYIATGRGMFGSSQEYLENLVGHFEILGIQDEVLFTLLELTQSYVE
ncbi:MAG: gamma-glutamylcyclotransferase [Arenicellales bacterium]|nr:gamma-glutamylcyclotransferase [Arenicellales bacterium]